MADNTQGTTVSVAFFSCNSDQTNLFSVQPGIPALNALQMASTFLDVARDSAYRADASCKDNSGSAAAYMVTMAKAVVDSVINGVEFNGRDDRRFRDLLERLHLFFYENVLIVNEHATKKEAADANGFLSWVEQQVKGGAQ